MDSPLKRVELDADVYMTCLQHALSTEHSEVMGLLIGNLENGIAKISAPIILQRLDKKKDRVEISSEQLLKAATEAERLTTELKRPMRVLGWYHSHPHITVFPSHVDVRTQAMYQMMDPGFVGLIFSVFTEDKDTKEQEVVLCCFQSKNNERVSIPLEIISSSKISQTCLKTMKQLPLILTQEEDINKSCMNNKDILSSVYNGAVHTRALTNIAEIVTKPLFEMIIHRMQSNDDKKKFLQVLLKELQWKYTELKNELDIQE